MLLLWLKALHVISVIAWMAGILYFWRLLVYHSMETESVVIERFIIMERRLRNAIMTPAMVLSLFFGVWMLLIMPDFYFKQHWMHAKLTCILFLFVNHAMAVRASKKLLANPKAYNHVYLRIMNEVPTLIMIIIVIMVIVRPF